MLHMGVTASLQGRSARRNADGIHMLDHKMAPVGANFENLSGNSISHSAGFSGLGATSLDYSRYIW